MYGVDGVEISHRRTPKNFSMKVSVLIMGRRSSTNNTTTNTNANKGYVAKAHIKGVVSDFYDKGKKYDYITIDVPHSYDEYYDRFKVAVNKNYEVPDNGEDIEIDCYIKTYKGDVSFKHIFADSNN